MKWIIGLSLGMSMGAFSAQAAAASAEKIAFVADNDIQIMNADGSGATKVTKDGDKRRESTFSLSPDARSLAFAADGEIFTIGADGSNEKQLRKKARLSDSGSRQPAWSPDGKRIAFTSGPGMFDTDIFVMDADGSNAKNLTDDTKDKNYDHSPVWSPDGTRIAYVVQPGQSEGGGTNYNVYDIAVINADGSGKRVLTPGEEKEENPVWSPDGRRLLFTRDVILSKKQNVTVMSNSDLWIMNADGSGQKNLTKNKNKGEDQWPSWSPDGGKIAFQARKEGGPGAVYVMGADGSNVKALTAIAWGQEYHDVRWSPDGKRILFMDGHDKIMMMASDGSGLAEVGKGMSPAWPTAPGKRIAAKPEPVAAKADAPLAAKAEPAPVAKAEPAPVAKAEPAPVVKAKPAPSPSDVEISAARAEAYQACQTEIGIFCNSVKDQPAQAVACLRKNYGDLWAQCREKLDMYKPNR